MKKYIVTAIIALMLVVAATACTDQKNENPGASAEAVEYRVHFVPGAWQKSEYFQAFFNNYLFAENTGGTSFSNGFIANDFFVKGENTVTFIAKPAVAEPNTQYNPPLNEDTVVFTVGVSSRKGNAGEWTTHVSKEFVAREGKKKGDMLLFSLSFDNPSALDNTALLTESPRCNDTPERFAEYHPKMRAFAEEMYTAVKRRNTRAVIAASSRLISDDAKNSGDSPEKITAMVTEAVKDIGSSGLEYTLESPDQFVFLPTCEGRLWRVGVMKTPEDGKKMMEEVRYLPHAIRRYDYQLFNGKRDGGLARILPVMIAFPDGKCRIVRVP